MNRSDPTGRSSRPPSQEGSALVSALAVGLIVATVLTTLAARSIGDSIASAAAADRAQAAGLAEYAIARTIAELDAGLALELRRTPGAGERVLTVTPSEAAAVAGLDGVGIDVRLLPIDSADVFRIVASATVGGRTHTLVADVRPRSSSDHLLLTTHEAIDPALFRRPRAGCAVARGDAARALDCVDTSLPDGVLDGPVHSDDLLALPEGVIVASMLTTSRLHAVEDVIAPQLAAESDPAPLSNAPFGLLHRAEVALPLAATRVVSDTHVTCRFRGPTLLRFEGPNVRVTSPRSAVRDSDPVLGGDALGCFGVDRDLLIGPTTILLPERAVIEVVRDTDVDCADHPLGLGFDEDTDRSWWCSDGDAFVWGSYSGARTVVAHDNIQLLWDVVPHGDGGPTTDGSGFGSRTPGDALGLVAGDSIVLRRLVGRPVRRIAPYGQNLAFAGPSIPPFGTYPQDAPTDVPTTWDAPVIVASLVALRGSVGVQNPFFGEPHPGPVFVQGSVATRFRGLFSWEDRTATGALRGAMGYPLVLRYDPSLVDLSPPGMPLTEGGAVRILSLMRVP